MTSPPVMRPTRVEIDLDALRFNLWQIRKRTGPACEILAVVKADAYGHGASGVAPALAAAGADQFGVALVGEGVALRRCGISQPVIVLGGVFPGEEADILEHDLQPALYDLAAIHRLAASAQNSGRRVACHLKVDTGMGRLGFRPECLDEVLAVGDLEFQKKCYEVLNRFKHEGVTIVFVSHDLESVKKFCSRTLLISHGQQVMIGETREVVAHYQGVT